jgi:valyl-tRNA synthetase
MATYPKLADIKTWSPEVEKAITDQWKKQGNAFNPKTKKKIYSIDTPPPYINSPVHMGHATTYSFMDMFARYRRMKGYEVLFPLGLDKNGLPIEMGAEKKYNISAFKVGRDKFIDYCKQLLAETTTESIDTFAKLGISFNSYKDGTAIGDIYHTDAPEYRAITQATFISLFKKGKIYEDNRINNWDTKLQTTVADAEIEYKDIASTFNDIVWSIKGTKEQIIVATTRPELICTCGMVIYHPDDKRYQHLEGKKAISPLFNKEILIKAHPFANPEKGSGLVMMCSVGDLTDIQFFREQKLKPIIAITKEGRMNEHAGFLAGLKVKEARTKILEELKIKGLLKEQKQIQHRTPVSERSGAEIEFIEMPEFYLKQLEVKEDIRKIAQKINFYAPESQKILDRWLDSISIDWPISRRRFYATPVPLWHAGTKIAVPQPGTYYEPWKQEVPQNAEVYEKGKKVGTVKDFKKLEWKGEERVLDTWFDSSISELVMLKYTQDDVFFKKAYPASLRPQGKEIVRTWLYYTLLRGYLETGKPAFEDVWIHNHITDEKGHKMSKSLGNIVDPQAILKEYGAEALRFWVTTEGDLSKQDLPCSKDKIKGELKTMNKLLNVARFIQQFPKPKKAKLTAGDEILIQTINQITKETDERYAIYDFNHPAIKLRYILWELLASHYLEMVKNRAYNNEKAFSKADSEAAQYTLHYLLERLVVLLYPIIPQITSVLAHELKYALDTFPEATQPKDNTSVLTALMEFNSSVWKKKREQNLTLRDPIANITIPQELKPFAADLRACHNLSS